MNAIFGNIKLYNENKNANAIKIFTIFGIYLENIGKNDILSQRLSKKKTIIAAKTKSPKFPSPLPNFTSLLVIIIEAKITPK